MASISSRASASYMLVVTENAELLGVSNPVYQTENVDDSCIFDLLPAGAADGETGARGCALMAQNGHGFSAVVSEEGGVYTWGSNSHGQLGRAPPTGGAPAVEHPQPVGQQRALVEQIPQTVFGGSLVMQVALGYWHSLVLSVNGTVYTSGCGSDGQLGHGDRDGVTIFKRVAALTNVRVSFVAAGIYMSAMIGDGRVYTCGHGPNGELGLGYLDLNPFPITMLLPTRLPKFGVASSVLLRASRHVVVVQADGKMYIWGRNRFGQLGLGDVQDRALPTVVPFQPVVTADCGTKHTVVLGNDRVVYSCGWMTLDPLADEPSNGLVLARVDGIPSSISVSAGQISGQRSVVVTDGGLVYTWRVGRRYAPILRPLDARVGRYNLPLPELSILALVMGTHKRLGETSLFMLLDPEILVRLVHTNCKSWPSGPAGAFEGLARFHGGGEFNVI